MPGNYNALTGYGMNPYDPRRDPREATFDGRPALSTGGSSSGIGTAASFWAANVGTETVRVDPEPGQPEHARRDQADGRADQPLRRHPDHRRPGHGRPDGPQRHRRRDPAGCARRAPRPIRTTRRRRPARRRRTATTRVPETRRAARARASASRAPSSTRGTTFRAQGAARRAEPEQARVMAEAIAILKQQGAVIVDPADPERARDRPAAATSWLGHAADETPRGRTPTARSCSSTA